MCVKGDASKSDSDMDLYSRSMEDVTIAKRDVAASTGKTSKDQWKSLLYIMSITVS